MADEEKKEGDDEKKSGSLGKILIWLVVVSISIGGGFATPLVIAKLSQPAEKTEDGPAVPDPDEEVDYIDFDEVVVNLGDSRFSRYLKLKFSLEVPKSQKAEIETLIETKKAVLMNRIISHISEIKIDDLKGAFGQNRLRREMHDYFNEILFKDGIERIRNILFREFHVQ